MPFISPPLKIQGKKLKLLPFLSEHIKVKDNDIFVEPFMGSGVVGFNLAKEKAIFSDINWHIVNFYRQIQLKNIDLKMVSDFLKSSGSRLQTEGENFYYSCRENLNQIIRKYDNNYNAISDEDKKQSALLFLFLNRTCFNGTIRFNLKGEFNVPFCRNIKKLSETYIQKIVSDFSDIEHLLKNKPEWKFYTSTFDETLRLINQNDRYVVYLDPPYFGLDINYYNKYWTEQHEIQMKKILDNFGENVSCYLSNWLSKVISNKSGELKTNPNIRNIWLSQGYTYKSFNHRYINASDKDKRTNVEEILIFKEKNKKD